MPTIVNAARGIAFSVLVVAASLASYPTEAQTSDWPTQPVHIIGGLGAGGPADLATRIVAQALQQKLGQTFIAENLLGAGGAQAVLKVSRAPKDGYTLGAPTTGPLTILPSLLEKPLYQTLDAVTPIALIAAYPYVLCVRKDLPVNNVAELIEYAKKNPGKLTYGSGGVGTSNHLGMEWLKQLTKTDMVHVPYKGDNGIVADLVAGRIDLAMNTPAVIASQISAGNVKALAVASKQRIPVFAQLPTLEEAGIKDFVVEAYTIIVGPANMPKEITGKINAEINEVIQQKDIRDRMAQSTMYPRVYALEEVSKFISDQQALWGGIIKTSNIPLE